MAITYKSQGAGASTETSGAALSPLCPAVVDAGDILIAHVFWESNVTAPATPGGWTLLFGPSLIETSIARHWVFGKIADGTEDGAAVAFGAPAVTTQRAARVYSFAGRTGGLITELVTGFAETSHATDPQMPTVTTTLNGALAVALVAQNDNNAFGSPTGETGGDWVEAVAEYTVALTPGFSIGIETATPTADPGTITGGSMATTNDPCGVIGFQIKQNNNQTAAADVGVLTLTGFAASVLLPISVSIGLGALDLAGFVPTVTASSNQTVTAGFGELTVTGFEPTVSVAADNTTVETGLGALTVSGFAPVLDFIVNPGLGELDLTGFNPVVGFHINPDVGVLNLTGFEPVVSVSDNISVATGTGELTLSGFAITTNLIVNTGFGEISINGFAPSISVSDNILAETQSGVLDLTGLSPAIQVPVTVSSQTGTLDITGFAPDIIAGVTILPDTGELDITGFNPTVSITENIIAETGTGQATLSGFSPSLGLSFITGRGELFLIGFEPSVNIGSANIQVDTLTGLLALSGFSPLVTGDPPKQIIIKRSPITAGFDTVTIITNEVKRTRIITSVTKKSKIGI